MMMTEAAQQQQPPGPCPYMWCGHLHHVLEDGHVCADYPAGHMWFEPLHEPPPPEVAAFEAAVPFVSVVLQRLRRHHEPYSVDEVRTILASEQQLGLDICPRCRLDQNMDISAVQGAAAAWNACTRMYCWLARWENLLIPSMFLDTYRIHVGLNPQMLMDMLKRYTLGLWLPSGFLANLIRMEVVPMDILQMPGLVRAAYHDLGVYPGSYTVAMAHRDGLEDFVSRDFTDPLEDTRDATTSHAISQIGNRAFVAFMFRGLLDNINYQILPLRELWCFYKLVLDTKRAGIVSHGPDDFQLIGWLNDRMQEIEAHLNNPVYSLRSHLSVLSTTPIQYSIQPYAFGYVFRWFRQPRIAAGTWEQYLDGELRPHNNEAWDAADVRMLKTVIYNLSECMMTGEAREVMNQLIRYFPTDRPEAREMLRLYLDSFITLSHDEADAFVFAPLNTYDLINHRWPPDDIIVDDPEANLASILSNLWTNMKIISRHLNYCEHILIRHEASRYPLPNPYHLARLITGKQGVQTALERRWEIDADARQIETLRGTEYAFVRVMAKFWTSWVRLYTTILENGVPNIATVQRISQLSADVLQLSLQTLIRAMSRATANREYLERNRLLLSIHTVLEASMKITEALRNTFRIHGVTVLAISNHREHILSTLMCRTYIERALRRYESQFGQGDIRVQTLLQKVNDLDARLPLNMIAGLVH